MRPGLPDPARTASRIPYAARFCQPMLAGAGYMVRGGVEGVGGASLHAVTFNEVVYVGCGGHLARAPSLALREAVPHVKLL